MDHADEDSVPLWGKAEQHTRRSLKLWASVQGPDCLHLCYCMNENSTSTLLAKSLQSSLSLCNHMDCSPPGPSAHGIFQARIREWVAISSPMGSSQPKDRTCVSFFFFFNFIFKLYNIVLVLPNIEMNPPQVYMCSPS